MRYLSISEAVEAVKSGKVIIFPTETFFGIGGLALDAQAVDGAFRAKQRDAAQALPVIIGHEDQLFLLAEQVPGYMIDLLRIMWPGPLNVLFSAKATVPPALTGGTGKVAVRLTSHPAARELCLLCGPLTASSANLSGEAPTTQAGDLSAPLAQACAGVLDMPPCPKGGQASTLVEIFDDKVLRILRPGAVPNAALLQAGWKIIE